MMKLMMALVFTFILTGCSSYMEKLYSELDDKSGSKRNTQKDKFAHFKANNFNQTKSINSSNYSYMPPKTQRSYKAPEETTKKRYTTDDLNDNAESNSLWANIDSDNHLFTQNNSKQNGDIVVVNVYEELKTRITMELKRAFPDMKKPAAGASKAPASTTTAASAPGTESADSKKDEAAGDQEKVFDKISSIVVDQINKDHLLIRGRKNLIYKGQKRTVEIEALVARRSISAEDTISSNDILESYVDVLR